MRKTIVLAGMPLVVLGAVILGYGLLLRGQSTIESPSQWQVTWYAMRDRFGTWGDVIDTGTFPVIFNVDPLTLAATREEPIGFKALIYLNFLKDMTIQFTIGGDDGVIALYMDGNSVIGLQCPDPNVSQSSEALVTVGRHTLELQYYQVLVEDDAAALFNMTNPEEQGAINMATGGGALLFMGIIVALIGFVLKPKASS